ncbi:hypothetical protein JFU49_00955 [Pseudomonas sp. TH03]|uniref:DUF6124 family protein n=1 Tax=Pseudomonas sp. TH03 TaxID=2796369 RepID=UPI0019113CBF|nr:DUF6124 family protein [Pseudomonas sp. TH03]MBK5548859.1 hypothetical protein [Pseudomonas sp. TH03]
MFKATPNPPETESATTSAALEEKKLKEAADRALSYYLGPTVVKNTPRKPSTIFMIAPNTDTETLLVNACESLASASVMASDFAALLEGPQRNTMLALQQIIMLSELAVNRALDNLDPQGSAA